MTGIAGMMFANRTPPAVSGGDPNWANVGLLLHMDGADNGTTFTDSSTTASVWTVTGGARTDTGEKKFGTASFEMQAVTATFNSQTRGFISSNSATYTALKMKDNFTFEFWYYSRTASGLKGISSYGSFSFLIYVNGTILTLELSSVTAGTTTVQRSFTAGTVSASSWHHIAMTREGANVQVWVNGTRTLNVTDLFTNEIRTSRAADGAAANDLVFGSTGHGVSTQHLGGWLDEMRITQSIIRYSGATITVPTVAFSDN
jgi:hypothetical protein